MAAEIRKITTTGWRRASGPFSQASASASDIPLGRPNPKSPTLVAVYNAARADYRVKMFVHSSKTIGGEVEIDGHSMVFTHERPGLSVARPSSSTLYRLLAGLPPVDQDEAEEIPGEFLDVCIETEFKPSEKNYRNWVGDPLQCPRWMGVESIEVTPPKHSGGWHQVELRAPGMLAALRDHGRGLPSIRVNGIWTYATPVADRIDKKGHSVHGGLWTLLCDPRDLDVVRGYKDLGGGDEENEPSPVRSRWLVKRVDRQVGIPYEEYTAWMATVQAWSRAVLGMAGTQGQVQIFADKADQCASAIQRYGRMLTSRFQQRPTAYDTYSQEAWIQEVGGKPAEWAGKIKQLEAILRENDATATRLAKHVAEQRVQHDKALEKLEELDEKYEPVIRYLFSAQAVDRERERAFKASRR